MNKFNDGDVVYHKSTRETCVIICLNTDGTYKVRTDKGEAKNYYPQELKNEKGGGSIVYFEPSLFDPNMKF